MYLKDGREIIESDKYPGYFVDQSNGAWCDEEGNYVGGIADDGDKPGRAQTAILDVPDTVYVSRTGKQYYPKPNKTALWAMDKDEADQKGYKPSAGYCKFVEKLYKKHMKAMTKKEVLSSMNSLIRDINEWTIKRVKASLDKDDEAYREAMFQLEGLIIDAQQELTYLTDWIEENVKEV